MAYWIQETNVGNSSACKSYMCDYRSDIAKLPRIGIHGEEQEGDSVADNPCSWGSDCTCLEDTSIWILGKDTNQWIEI